MFFKHIDYLSGLSLNSLPSHNKGGALKAVVQKREKKITHASRRSACDAWKQWATHVASHTRRLHRSKKGSKKGQQSLVYPALFQKRQTTPLCSSPQWMYSLPYLQLHSVNLVAQHQRPVYALPGALMSLAFLVFLSKACCSWTSALFAPWIVSLHIMSGPGGCQRVRVVPSILYL